MTNGVRAITWFCALLSAIGTPNYTQLPTTEITCPANTLQNLCQFSADIVTSICSSMPINKLYKTV